MPCLTSSFARKLEDILRELTPLEQRGKVTRFLNGTKDTDKLSGVVEDIRDAMMDYQVCPNILHTRLVRPPNLCIRRLYNRISTIKAVSSL